MRAKQIRQTGALRLVVPLVDVDARDVDGHIDLALGGGDARQKGRINQGIENDLGIRPRTLTDRTRTPTQQNYCK